MDIIYLRSSNRRPVRLRAVLWSEDDRGAIPAGWCEGCGKEVYEEGGLRCRRCEREDEK
ncbi:MAG: hypothetical protein IJB47_03220 [Oscillospiraceae bacterium]|nr:hypothetical protein [Oscillospiraceae bacterium]